VRINSTSASLCEELEDPQPLIFLPDGGVFVEKYSVGFAERGYDSDFIPGYLTGVRGIRLLRTYTKFSRDNGETVDAFFYIFCGYKTGVTPCDRSAQKANPTYLIAAELSFARQVYVTVSDNPLNIEVHTADISYGLDLTEIYTRCESDSIDSDRCCNAGPNYFSELRPPSIDATVSLDGVTVSVGGVSLNLPWTEVVTNSLIHRRCYRQVGRIETPIDCVEEYLLPSSDSVGITTFGLVDTAGCGPCECTADLTGRTVVFKGKTFTYGSGDEFTSDDGSEFWEESPTGVFRKVTYDACDVSQQFIALEETAEIICSETIEEGPFWAVLFTVVCRERDACGGAFDRSRATLFNGIFTCGSGGFPTGTPTVELANDSLSDPAPTGDCASFPAAPSINFT
jgi:hypothetical protein